MFRKSFLLALLLVPVMALSQRTVIIENDPAYNSRKKTFSEVVSDIFDLRVLKKIFGRPQFTLDYYLDKVTPFKFYRGPFHTPANWRKWKNLSWGNRYWPGQGFDKIILQNKTIEIERRGHDVIIRRIGIRI